MPIKRSILLSTLLALAVLACLAPTGRVVGPTVDAERRQLGLAKTTADGYIDRLGRDYKAFVDARRKLLFVSSLDADHLARAVKDLSRFADAQRTELLRGSPSWYVVVVLPAVDDYRRKLLPKGLPETTTGFYRPAEKTLVSVDRGRVLRHEYTHALHHADAGADTAGHALWVVEGLATLYESAELDADGFDVGVDRRLRTLKKSLSDKTLPPLADLLEADANRFRSEPGLWYAYGRYVMLYLHRKGKLSRFYRHYKTAVHRDPTGRESLEETLDEDLPGIESDVRAWLLGLRVPRSTARNEGRLGVRLKNTPQGPTIVGFIAGGDAERSGRLEEGDVIQAVNGKEVRRCAGVFAAVRAAGALRTITIRLVRAGAPIEVTQPLGKPAQMPPRPGRTDSSQD
jgi:hypothetical protein